MLFGRTTLSKFLIEQLAHLEDQGRLASLLVDVAAAIKAISAITAKGALGLHTGALEARGGEGGLAAKLNALSNEIVIGHCEWSGQLAGMLTQELESPYEIPAEFRRGEYLLAFDPLEGARNIETNVAVGTTFSVVRHDGEGRPEARDFLRPGIEQCAAGYAIYGPATMLVITVGKGTHGFTLDREIGNFILTHPDLSIPEDTSEFAINTCNERFWEAPVQRYVTECKAGKSGIRRRDFNMRWIASVVAETHRILTRGGVFLSPRDFKDPARPGRLRLLYEANPMAFIVEQAGGAASTGRGRVLEVLPQQIHQRAPVMFGSRSEIERIERYHREFDNGEDRPFVSPLFNERSLYRPETAA